MSAPSIRYRTPQKGADTTQPLTYTGAPWQLFFSDVKLFFRNIIYIPFIFLPVFPAGAMDELYAGDTNNLIDVVFHTILFITQLGFLISLFVLTYLPVAAYLLYIGVFLVVNSLICRHFNKNIPDDGLYSTQDEFSRQWVPHPDERWIFLNGICVGKNWLQNNVDRLSRTFHRPIVGVHNKTSGVVFDLVQCLIQRSLLYATSDVRDCYVLVKKALYEKGVKKVVLILHSQGGIEGGMIVDWLLDEVPQNLLQYLEIYTFGNLANHFSNPRRTFTPPEEGGEVGPHDTHDAHDNANTHEGAISHIEHYANKWDFASIWGVLNFTRANTVDHLQNRFMGKVFVNPRGGHQLNQHYLHSIFPLDEAMRQAREPEEGDFMNMEAISDTTANGKGGKGKLEDFIEAKEAKDAPSSDGTDGAPTPPPERMNGKHVTKMKDVSRLWQYRNGGKPVS